MQRLKTASVREFFNAVEVLPDIDKWTRNDLARSGKEGGVFNLALLSRIATESDTTLKLTAAIEAAESACVSIEKVEKRYKSYLELGAGVDYWKSKAANHSSSKGDRRKYLAIGSVMFGLGIIFLPVVFYSCLLAPMSAVLKTSGLAPDYLFATFLGIFALYISIGVWGLRVLSKLYLSEHHLMTDAKERVAMIQTYLALTDENKMDSNDRTALLASIFRPTQDGVIRAEGFDPTIAGLFANLSSRGSSS